MSTKQAIKQKALELGFDLAGITNARPIAKNESEILKNHIKNNLPAQMNYMYRNFEKRISPEKLMPGAKSVICVALNYKPIKKHNLQYSSEPACCIADFAKYEDYHNFIKFRLFKLAEFITENFNANLSFKVCVDSAPIAERSLAARAGLGFIGKNKMLINPNLGLSLLLGELIVDIELEPDKPMKNLCAGCDKCLSACPGGAFASGNFDSAKCISYLTVENPDQFQPEDKQLIANNLFGCDRCIKACPFYKNSPPRKNKEFKFLDSLAETSLCDLLYWSQKDFDLALKDTPLQRLGLENLKRNALTCLENQSQNDNYGTINTSSSFSGLSQPE